MEADNQQQGEPPLTPPHSDPESPLEMTVVLNEAMNPYWSNDNPLRCASNADLSSVGGKSRRDFKFQVIQVRNGPRWFVFPSNKDENNDATQLPALNNPSDQENVRDNANSMRRSMRIINRRKVSNEFNKAGVPMSGVVSYEEQLCNATQNAAAPMSDPTTRRINTKPIDCRFQVASLSPPSTSSECSTFSNQSTLSSCASDTFQILAVANKCESDDEDDQADSVQTAPTCLKDPNKQQTPLILVSSADPPTRE